MDSKRAPLWLERVLLAVGCACIVYYGYMTLEARQFHREQTTAFEAHLTRGETGAPAALVPPVLTPATPAPPGASTGRTSSLALTASMVGILEIPRLRMEAVVMPGDDAKTLDVAVGHLPDTPKPWEPGNSAVAAHRDGLFRPLKNIKVGDDLLFRTAHGEFSYEVRELKIVSPKDLSVLEPTSTDMLTLITCYPFNFVGNAPKRFIVRAARVMP